MTMLKLRSYIYSLFVLFLFSFLLTYEEHLVFCQ